MPVCTYVCCGLSCEDVNHNSIVKIVKVFYPKKKKKKGKLIFLSFFFNLLLWTVLALKIIQLN